MCLYFEHRLMLSAQYNTNCLIIIGNGEKQKTAPLLHNLNPEDDKTASYVQLTLTYLLPLHQFWFTVTLILELPSF